MKCYTSFCSFPHEYLHFLKRLTVNDGGVCVLCIILVCIPVIVLPDIWKRVSGICFLAKRIANVFFVCEDFSNHLFVPYSAIPCGWNALLRHPCRDPLGAVSVEIRLEDPTDQHSFFWDDLQVFSIDQPVAKRGSAGDKLTSFHPPFVADALVLRDGDGLLLGQCAGDAHHQFGGERLRVDILFFKPCVDKKDTRQKQRYKIPNMKDIKTF